jgi:hypothetical protein
MLIFPQLTSGSISQLPVSKVLRHRRIVNDLVSGGLITLTDLDTPLIQWNLHYSGLSASEWDALLQLFRNAEGRLNPFLMLDPLDNLLAWSEDLTRDVWHKDGLLQLMPNSSDPLGTSRATHVANIGTATQGLSQTLAVPGWFRYCFSFYARSNTATTVQATISNIDDSIARAIAVTTQWGRYSCPSALSGASESLTLGVALPALSSIELFGLQLEPQPLSSSYKETAQQNGVYARTRFVQDFLTGSADSLGEYSTKISLVSRTGV